MKGLRTQGWACSTTSFLPTACTTSTWVSTALMGSGASALGAQGVAADPVFVSSGYVQGMSDLLSPILFVVQNEVDAFWCFCGFMELVVRCRLGVREWAGTATKVSGLHSALTFTSCFLQHGNFEESQETMKRQLGQLLLLLRVLDQPLCDFLGRSCVRPSE